MKRYLMLGMAMVFSFFVFSSVSESASLQSRIIGKWVEVNGDEKIEFLKDGTVIVVSKGFSGVGNYRFIDENRLRMDISGFWGIMGALVFEVSFDKEGHLTLGMEGKVTKYAILEEAVKSLIAALKDEDVEVRKNAAGALGEIKDSRAVEPLIATLKDKDVGVRANAAEALGEIKDSRAVEPLITALKDGSAWVRKYAAWALGEIKDSRAVDPLVAALKDMYPDVREEAAKALKKLEASAKGAAPPGAK